MRLSLWLSLLFVSNSALARVEVANEIFEKIVEQGVPRKALQEMVDFERRNLNAEFVQDTYVCEGRDPSSVKPCDEGKRRPTARKVRVLAHPHGALIDYAKSSLEKRFYLINWETGVVESFMTTHGRGSGMGPYAVRFSNKKDSKQTSLGMYLAGEVYSGSYGPTLRMYGLEKSNDQAYRRDIVLHGAWYADPKFLQKLDPKTGKPYDRLGVSWGCPALSLDVARRVITLLKEGGLIYHYHKEFMETARDNQGEAQTPPLPPPRPPDL